MTEPGITTGAVAFHQPRPVRFIRRERLGNWRLKL